MTIAFLDGWRVEAQGGPAGPALRAARALRELGARVAVRVAADERLRADGRPEVRLPPGAHRRSGVAAEHLGLLAAAALLGGSGAVGTAPARLLTEGMLERRHGVLVRCRDGWLACHWRAAAERTLLEAMVGPLAETSSDEAWSAARAVRLLVAPVREAPRASPVGLPRLLAAPWRAPVSAPARVVDWTNLWAGPWATARVADEDAVSVVRIEPPARRDGYLRSTEGRPLWWAWNGGKRLALVDAREPAGFAALGAELVRGDVLVFGQTARTLAQLGFDEAWMARKAPRLFRLSLGAFDEPFDELPGTGGQAAALAGLLWRGPNRRPAIPRPWADPLLGAWALLILRARAASGLGGGGHVRISLESAAARASAPPSGTIEP